VILLAFAAHGTIAKMTYAAGPGVARAGDISEQSWQLGAQLMWYGGDAVELLLVIAFALQWYHDGGRRLERARREREGSHADKRVSPQSTVQA
jgi:putative membrane protein